MRPAQTYMKTMNTEEFIMLHRNDDVRTLALKAAGTEGIDLGYALNQIAGWQTARKKLPQWAADSGIKYPPHISMEQCSSEQTATYKANIAQRLINKLQDGGTDAGTGTTLVDLTGGFGVDFSYIARRFSRAVYIEQQSHLCDIARHNMSCLGISQAEVMCGDSTQIIASMGHVTMVYADPARRDSHGGRTFAISDCTPDTTTLKDMLLRKADFIMIKLSPMLDWRKAAADMGSCVGEVHIVSTGNECKELLLVMSKRYSGIETIYCINDDTTFDFAPDEAAALPQPYGAPSDGGDCAPEPAAYLYEPNASLMKAGCFSLISRRYGIRQISRDSHLFVSSRAVADFPGRPFKVRAVTSMNKSELKKALAGIAKANIAVRNFPMTADALRKKLKLKDGGDTYIFGTTENDGRHTLFICEKQR